MHRLGRDAWWADRQGLFTEIIEVLRTSELAPPEELRDSIGLARRQANLASGFRVSFTNDGGA